MILLAALLLLSCEAATQLSQNVTTTTTNLKVPRDLAVACTDSYPSTTPMYLNPGSNQRISCSAGSLKYASYSIWSSPGDLLKIKFSTDCSSDDNADTANYVSLPRFSHLSLLNRTHAHLPYHPPLQLGGVVPTTGADLQTILNVNVFQPYIVCVHMKCKNTLLACTYSYYVTWDTDSSRTSISDPPLPPSSSPTSSATPSFGYSPSLTPSQSPKSLVEDTSSSSCTFVNAAYAVGSTNPNSIVYFPVAACSGAAINGGKFTVTVNNPNFCDLDVVPSYGSSCVSSGYTTPPSRGSNLLSGAYGEYTWTDVPCKSNNCCVVIGDNDVTGCTVYVSATFSISAKAAAVQDALAYLLANPVILAAAGALVLFLGVMWLCSESICQCLRRILCCKHEADDSCLSCFSSCCCCSSDVPTNAKVATSSSTPSSPPSATHPPPSATHSSASHSSASRLPPVHPHPLQYVRRKGRAIDCDVCDSTISDARTYRCFKCDYDECIECAARRVINKVRDGSDSV